MEKAQRSNSFILATRDEAGQKYWAWKCWTEQIFDRNYVVGVIKFSSIDTLFQVHVENVMVEDIYEGKHISILTTYINMKENKLQEINTVFTNKNYVTIPIIKLLLFGTSHPA